MRRIAIVVAALLALSLSACFPPMTSNPIGTTAGMKADPSLLGAWKGGAWEGQNVAGKPSYLHVMWAPNGTFVAALIPSSGRASDFIMATFTTARFGAYGFLNAQLAHDDGRPADPAVLATLLGCAARHSLAEVSPMVCDLDDPQRLAFPLRRGLVWRRRADELRTDGSGQDLLPGIASLFNGALFHASALEVVGVPDIRLFVRGDEVEMHRRLARSGLPFGTCLDAVYLHPQGSDEFKPILRGRMHTQYPDDVTKRYFTYRNRGYLQSQPGLRRLIPQEWLRFGWFFLVSRRDPAGLLEWLRLRRLGRGEKFGRPDQGETQGERSDGTNGR